MNPPDHALSAPVRVVLLGWTALMTVACFTMFTWIVHDRRMPGWPVVLDRVQRGSLADLAGGDVMRAVVVDVLLFAAFGLAHAGCARRAVYDKLRDGLGLNRQALRAVFMTVTAAAWLGVLFYWQHTGRIVFDLRPALAAAGVTSEQVAKYGPLVPFAFSLLTMWTVVRHGILKFVGMRQLISGPERTNDIGAYRDGRQTRLLTTGTYGFVRHPMYTYLLASVIVRPVLSLDLLVWFSCAVVFLIVAIPYEERKLIAIFGAEYEAYQRRTPAFIPFWPTRSDG